MSDQPEQLTEATYESNIQWTLEGPVMDAILYLQRTCTAAQKEGWTDLRLSWGYDGCYEPERALHLKGKRPETEDEKKQRLEREEAQREAQTRQEEHDRETYKRLKARFEPEEK